MSNCFVCEKVIEDDKTSLTVKGKGVKTLLERSIAKGRSDHQQFLLSVSQVTVHAACYKYYSDKRTDKVTQRRSSSGSTSTTLSTSSSVSEVHTPIFDFSNLCFICTDAISNDRNIREKRRNRISVVSKPTFKTSLINLLSQRTDLTSIDILNRIKDIPDLVAIGAKYHTNCSKRLWRVKLHDERKVSDQGDKIGIAMEYIYSYLRSNADECQFKLSELMKKIETDYIPEKRTIKERLLQKYGNDISIWNLSTRETIICFRNTGYETLSKSWYLNKNPTFLKKDCG